MRLHKDDVTLEGEKAPLLQLLRTPNTLGEISNVTIYYNTSVKKKEIFHMIQYNRKMLGCREI